MGRCHEDDDQDPWVVRPFVSVHGWFWRNQSKPCFFSVSEFSWISAWKKKTNFPETAEKPWDSLDRNVPARCLQTEMEELLMSVTTEFRLQMPRSSERKCKGYAFIEGWAVFFWLNGGWTNPFGGCLEGLFSDGGMEVEVVWRGLWQDPWWESENLSANLFKVNFPVIMVQWKTDSKTSLVSFVKGHFPRSTGYLAQSIKKCNSYIYIYIYIFLYYILKIHINTPSRGFEHIESRFS